MPDIVENRLSPPPSESAGPCPVLPPLVVSGLPPLAQLADALPFGATLLDLDGRIIYADRHAGAILGLTRAEITGRA